MDKLTSKENLTLLIGTICKTNNYTMNDKNRIRDIMVFIKSLNALQLCKKYNNNIDNINKSIIKSYKDHITNDKEINIHEALKKIILSNGNESANAQYESFGNDGVIDFSNFNLMKEQDKIEIVKYLNYESIWRDEFIIIDSRYQNQFNQDRTKLSFSLQANTKTKTISGNGAIFTTGILKDIIQMEIYPFTIPYNPLYENFYKQISLTILEWSTNVFEAYEDSQFHFAFDIDKIENNLIYLKPINNIFRFYKPVNYVGDFTLSFGAFLPRISFDLDRMNISSIDYSSTNGVITFGSNHNLITGDIVYISNFTSLTPAKNDDLLNEINRVEGHTIVKKNNTQIIINIDFTPMRYEYPQDSNIYPIDSFKQTPIVYFGSKRISIKMRLRYLLNPV